MAQLVNIKIVGFVSDIGRAKCAAYLARVMNTNDADRYLAVFDEVPTTILYDIDQSQAEKIRDGLEELGALVKLSSEIETVISPRSIKNEVLRELSTRPKRGFFGDFWFIFSETLFNTGNFFNNLDRPVDSARSLRFFIVLGYFLIILGGAVGFAVHHGALTTIKNFPLPPDFSSTAAKIGLGIAAVLLPIIATIYLFFSSVIYHLFVKMVGGRGAFGDTVALVSFKSAALVFLPLPFIGPLLALVYGLAIFIRGLKTVHRMNGFQALAVAIILPLVATSIFFVSALLIGVAVGLAPLIHHIQSLPHSLFT